jgi:ATP-dependent Clp protease ATP-binding subunit ClpC
MKMQMRISKSLEGLLAQTAFDLVRDGVDRSFKDCLMLAMLRSDSTLAYRLLSRVLQDWELYQITLRLKHEIDTSRPEPVTVEEFFADYAERLGGQFADERIISTAHAVIDIVGDTSTATSRILALYRIDASVLTDELSAFTSESSKDSTSSDGDDRRAEALLSGVRSDGVKEESLVDKFGEDLTALARKGALDGVVGREREIERVVQILSRRKKSNPLLIGEAGVGKSAIVEGLAMRIASGNVPPTIASKRIVSLDVASLVAGTKFRGEFEERMQLLLDELCQKRDTILFIDEIHTIVGAGSTQGSLDTANILKPALARGQIQAVGATTLAEYRANIEVDAALDRRFQCLMVEPTTPQETLEMLRRIVGIYSAHHRITYTDEALQACVELSNRYIQSRHLPDKAIDVLDESGARMTLSAERREVGAEDVAATVSIMTGIPLESIASDEAARLQRLEATLSATIIGQSEAVETLSRAVRRSRVGLKAESRPAGVFLFVGPTGVGKTLLAKELSRWLTSRRDALIRFDMSEFSERHNVARLIGSPPGYVGYGEGGQLTEAVRRNPYSVVLFDEIEKAHPEVFNTLLQLFDEGRLTDGAGRRVDFCNTMIIMTSNLGSRKASARRTQIGYDTAVKQSAQTSASESEYRKALEQTFAPEFINRIDDIVVFRTLSDVDIERIVECELGHILRRVESLGYKLRVTAKARRRLATLGYEPRYGARALKRVLCEHIEEPLSGMIVDGVVSRGDRVVADVVGGRVTLRVA